MYLGIWIGTWLSVTIQCNHSILNRLQFRYLFAKEVIQRRAKGLSAATSPTGPAVTGEENVLLAFGTGGARNTSGNHRRMLDFRWSAGPLNVFSSNTRRYDCTQGP